MEQADASRREVSDSKHTPGPWAVGDLDQNGQRIVRGEHIEICTCWHHSVGSIEKEMEANAQLIAAAPDLLKALQKIADARLSDQPAASGVDERTYALQHIAALRGWAVAAITNVEGRS